MNIIDVIKNMGNRGDAPTEAEKTAVENSTEQIGEEEIRRANEILRKYQAGKANLDARIVENEQFYKMRQWGKINKVGEQQNNVHSTAWLFSCIESRYADMMDSYPAPTIQPRQEDDKSEAQKLSAILPIINDQIGLEKAYGDACRYALKHGTIAFSVMWNPKEHNGLGDIAINRVDLLSLYWEPGITDIQDSSNVFHISLINNEKIEAQYPQVRGKLTEKPIVKTEYRYDDSIDTSDKTLVVDWYYKVWTGNKTVLHYCKYVGNTVLYATQNDPEKAEKGLYDHGMYPYIITPLFPVEGTITGYGYIDVGRDTQIQIDLLSNAVVENATVGSSPRYFATHGTKVNEAEFLDFTKKIVHVEGGTIGEEDLRPVDTISFNGNYINVLTLLVDQLKYTTANTDTSTGSTPSGVTAASAIAALQEAAGKNARSVNKEMYRVFRNVTYMEIELIRQFYDAPRYFRITPDDAQDEFQAYDNRGLMPQQIPGTDMLRSPEFDVAVTAEKESPYKKMEMNELAMTFYSAGFFDPANADKAVSCLSMMDFDRKRDVIQTIQQNGTIYQRLLQYQQLALQLAQSAGDTQTAEMIAQDVMSGSGGAIAPSVGYAQMPSDSGDDQVSRARIGARESASI